MRRTGRFRLTMGDGRLILRGKEEKIEDRRQKIEVWNEAAGGMSDTSDTSDASDRAGKGFLPVKVGCAGVRHVSSFLL